MAATMVASLFDPVENTTLPVWMYVVTSRYLRLSKAARSSFMAMRPWPPTFTLRSSAT